KGKRQRRLPFTQCYALKAIVRESFVSFSHAMNVFTLLHRRTLALCRIHQFTSQTLRHGFFSAVTGVIHQPTHCQRSTTRSTNLYPHLISCTTRAARLILYQRGNVFQSL